MKRFSRASLASMWGLLVLLSFVLSCSILEEDETISPVDSHQLTEKKLSGKVQQLMKALNGSSQVHQEIYTEQESSGEEGNSSRSRSCGCTFTIDITPNLQDLNWASQFEVQRVLVPDVNYFSAGTFSFPRQFYDAFVKPKSSVNINTVFNYDLEDPFLENGYITTKVACDLAPPVIYTIHIPPYNAAKGSSINIQKKVAITKRCGTIAVNASEG